MNKWKQRYDDWIPKYARLPLLIVLIFNFIVYYTPKVVESHLAHHTVSTAFDAWLPRVPVFIFIYVLAYIQWFLGYVIIARDSKERCYRVLSGEIIAKVFALAIFLIYPTTMDRPGVEVTGFSTWAMSFIYWTDTPTNLFPSVHCIESWLCCRGAIGLKRMPKWYTWLQFCFTALVFASVLFTKQHIWPDILGGVALAELGLLLSRLLHAERLFQKLERKPKE